MVKPYAIHFVQNMGITYLNLCLVEGSKEYIYVHTYYYYYYDLCLVEGGKAFFWGAICVLQKLKEQIYFLFLQFFSHKR
jgi:hypothetical protein